MHYRINVTAKNPQQRQYYSCMCPNANAVNSIDYKHEAFTVKFACSYLPDTLTSCK